MRMGVLLQKVVGWVERLKLRGIWGGCGRLDGFEGMECGKRRHWNDNGMLA